MKCLLVSYTQMGVNSTEHAAAFARGLARLGCPVRLAAVPDDPALPNFAFFACGADGALTPLNANARLEPADVVHVWTPRAAIWRFLEQHRRLISGPVVLHLEDDEDEVLRGMGLAATNANASLRPGIRTHRLENWSHPVLARCLAHAVDGATILSPDLGEHVPPSTPVLQLVPPLGPEWLRSSSSRPKDTGSGGREQIVVYSGGIHAAVAGDFGELCDAICALAKEGHRVRLVRCGPEVRADIGTQLSRMNGLYEDMGYLSEDRLRALLEQAAVLVQPGAPTKFNRRRLPAKIPPYLASGTPVVMPSCYPWLGVRDREHAILFERGDAADLAAAIAQVFESPAEARAMGARAAEFARERFDLRRCCEPLVEFYRALPRRARVPWHRIRKPRIELPLLVDAMTTKAGTGGAGLPADALRRVVLEEVRHPARTPGRNTVAQLFWPAGGGYLEHQSSVCPMHSGRWQRLRFGPGVITARNEPRFDPGDRTGICEVAAIDYRTPDGRLLHRFRSPDADRPGVTPHGTIIPLPTQKRGVWRWLSTGNDPQLLLPCVEIDRSVCVECWVRWTPFE